MGPFMKYAKFNFLVPFTLLSCCVTLSVTAIEIFRHKTLEPLHIVKTSTDIIQIL